MNSEDRTTILPAAGRPGGRAERRAAAVRRGRGRRARRRSGVGPVVAVIAAVAGTGVIAALAGAGYAAYDGADGDRDGRRAVALDPQIAAEAGNHDGVQVPGAGGVDSALLAGPAGSPSAADPAQAASASPATTGPATTGPAAPTGVTPPSTPAAPAVPTPSAPVKSGPGATARPTADTAATGAASAAATSAAPKNAGAPASGTSAQFAQQVVDLVNAQRAQQGCGPLTAEPRLAAAAQGHSEDMAARNFFDHASPEGYHADHRIDATGYRWSTWGENIARGQKDPAAVMESWMNSPGHRANILNCAFKQIGVGVRTGSGGPWWTQVFAAPS
ncbi:MULTISPECIES: CAP domain-containing protein [unclassified Kitasatospora]|uniref:CAP domain-containing protein n=1 Tax=unclassified Kitasatospora TaxID=2633591 RepID=UPI00382BDA11